MAYLYRRPGGRVEIREAYSTERGPRSRTLASFRGALEETHLSQAEARAQRPFDRAAVRASAERLGIPVREASADAPARELLARLRRGRRLDPRLARLLLHALSEAAEPGEDPELADVAEWLGASEVERGRALRDVLRLYDAIARSRDSVREAPPPRLPRFASREPRIAS